MEIRQARKSSVSIMPVFFCGAGVPRQEGGTGGRWEEEGPAQGQEDRAQVARGEGEVHGLRVRKERGT